VGQANLQIFDYHAYMLDVINHPTNYGFRDATCEDEGYGDCIWWSGADYHTSSTFQNLVAKAMLPKLQALGW
jgi:hypothetical protein